MSKTSQMNMVSNNNYCDLFFVYSRVVKRSSYRLNSLITVGIFLGFIGDLLYVIKLSPDMPETLTTAICNVCSNISSCANSFTDSLIIGKNMDKQIGICDSIWNTFC